MITDSAKFPKIKISAFSPFKNRDGDLVPGVMAKPAHLYEELARFKDGYYSVVIEQLRALQTKEERSKYKQENLTAFTFGCNFKTGDYRKQSNIESYTNILYIDIDHVGAIHYIERKKLDNPYYTIKDLRDELYNDLPCLFAGLSCSGTGVFLLVRFNEYERADAFEDIKSYILTKYKVEVDAACKDTGRLTFATHDSTAHITPYNETKTWELREEYIQRKVQIEEMRKNERTRVIAHHTTDVPGMIMSRAMNMIYSAQVGERHTKIRAAARLLGGYIATNLLDEEYVYNAVMAATAEINYDDMKDADKAIRFGIRKGKENPIQLNIITPEDPNFNYFVEQDEVRQREIKNLYSEIHGYIKNGTPITKLDYAEMAGRYFVDIGRIQDIAERMYEKFSYEFGVDHKPSIDKVEAYLTGKYEYRRDIISGDVQGRQVGVHKWQVIKFENVWRELQKGNFKFKFEDVCRLMASDYVPSFNLWDEFFSTIRMKDPEYDYIKQLSSYIHCQDVNEQDYFAEMFKKMLVRTVKCALDDNYANRTVFVLISPKQSNGKSTFIRWLNPFGNHKYYAENPLEDNKDSRIRLSETFIYNLEELATISKFEISRLKAIISQIGTRDRKPYGRQAENIIRRCSFFGSTNMGSFLTDDSNTRWLCFEISGIDWSYTDNVDKLQVWAQAYRLYKDGYDCELTQIEADVRDEKNRGFQVQTVESDLIMRYFRNSDDRDPYAQFMTTTSITERLLQLTKDSRIGITPVWVGRSLSRLGYPRVRKDNVYGFYVVPINQNQFNTYNSSGPSSEPYEFIAPF